MHKEIGVLDLLADGKLRNESIILASIKNASNALMRMVTGRLLELIPFTHEFHITKIGKEELEYYKAEREGIQLANKEEMIKV